MTVAICDDEQVICEQIENLIKKEKPNCQIILFSSGEDLLNTTYHFDIIFLDIQMEGINGMETARRLRNQKEEVILIFISGFKEYVFEAFDVSAFHYLLKPIEEIKFMEIFAKAVAELEKKKNSEEAFLIKSKGRTILVDKKTILYIESQNRMINIHTTKETVRIYSDMKMLEQELGNGFYRCHRGYIVNLGYIAEYGRETISLTNGEVLYLSRRKYREFVKRYMDYLQYGGVLLEFF